MGYLRDIETAVHPLVRLPGDKYNLDKKERNAVEDAFSKSNIALLKRFSTNAGNSDDMRAFAKECLDDITHSDGYRSKYDMAT